MKPSNDWQQWKSNNNELKSDPWIDFKKDPCEEYNKATRNWRIEFTITIKNIIQTISKFFKRKNETKISKMDD